MRICNKKMLSVALSSATLAIALPTMMPIVSASNVTVQAQDCLALSLSGHSWGTNYGVNATLTNTTGKTIDDWKIIINSKVEFDKIWSAKAAIENGKTVIKPMEWSKSIDSNGNIQFGYIGIGNYDSNIDYTIYYKVGGVWNQEENTNSDNNTKPVNAKNETANVSSKVNVSCSGSGWGTGYSLTVNISNLENCNIEDWKISIPTSQVDINSIWCASVTKNNDLLFITPLGYNQNITSKGSVNFGFIGKGEYPTNIDTNLMYKINGKWYSTKGKVEDSKTDPSTQAPSTQVPSTQVPSTQSPSTQAPSTQVPSTQVPSTLANDKQAKFGKEIHGGDATFYGAGPGGCCNMDDYEDLYYTVAMNRPDFNEYNLAGAYLEVTDKDGDKINVLVTNELPEGKPGDLDLSISAFDAIEPLETGRMKCTWKIIPFPTKNPIAYKFKPSSSQFWAEVQVREQRYPLKSVEYLSPSGEWIQLERKPYNYYCAPRGMGSAGPYTFRVTDMYGHVLIDENVPLDTTEKVIPGKANFPY